jgi:hypothetical protein
MFFAYRTATASLVLALTLLAAGCGGDNAAEGPAPAAPAPPAAPAAPKPPATVTLLEPADGAMGGHVDLFRWSPTEGADSYVIRIVALTGNRVLWESEPIAATETKVPATVSLEPEPHSWSVTARKGAEVLATSPTFKFTITP